MPKEQLFNSQDVEQAVAVITTLRYFPQEARDVVALELVRMVPHKRALDWLVEQCRTRLTEWPGLAELRGVLCTRFDPADGIDAYSTLSGFSPADGERKSIEQHGQRKTQELRGGVLRQLEKGGAA